MTWRRVWIVVRPGRRGQHHQVRWIDDRSRVRSESVGPSRSIAESLRRKREMELNAGLLGTVQTIRLGEFAREHLRLIGAQLQPKTALDHALVLKHFQDAVGNVPLESLSLRQVEQYVSARARAVKPPTVNRELRTLRGIFERARVRGYVRRNPTAGIGFLREPERTLRVLTVEEVGKLLAICRSARWRALVGLALTTGMRRGELAALRWSDVDMESGTIRVRCQEDHRTKSARNRMAILLPAAAKALSRLPRKHGLIFATRRGNMPGDGTFRMFGRIVQDAGIEPCTMHDLRRTFLSHLAMAGVNEAVVQDLAGHASVETTRRSYQRILPHAHREAARRLPWADFAIVPKSCRTGSTVRTAGIA